GAPRCSTFAAALPWVPRRPQEPWIPPRARPPDNHSARPIHLRADAARKIRNTMRESRTAASHHKQLIRPPTPKENAPFRVYPDKRHRCSTRQGFVCPLTFPASYYQSGNDLTGRASGLWRPVSGLPSPVGFRVVPFRSGQPVGEDLSGVRDQLPGCCGGYGGGVVLCGGDFYPHQARCGRYANNVQTRGNAGGIVKDISLHAETPQSVCVYSQLRRYCPPLPRFALILATSRDNSSCAATRSRLASEIFAY